MGRRRDGDCGDGFHRLNGHGDAEEEAGNGVVQSREDESGAEVEAVDEREGEDDGDVGSKVADSAAEFGPEGCFEAEAGGERREAGAEGTTELGGRIHGCCVVKQDGAGLEIFLVSVIGWIN